MTKVRKSLSLFLALIMVFSLSVAVSAASGPVTFEMDLTTYMRGCNPQEYDLPAWAPADAQVLTNAQINARIAAIKSAWNQYIAANPVQADGVKTVADVMIDFQNWAISNGKFAPSAFDLGGGSYIKKIGNLAEYNAGGNSGWVYIVNGSVPVIEANKYVVQSDENISFCYYWDYTEIPWAW